jgi:hypothetical protein
MPQYAILIYAADSAHGEDAPAAEREAHDRHGRELAESGRRVAAFALQPRATATSVRGDTVTDGPFMEAKEVVAGLCVVEAADLDAALEIARSNPATQQGGGVEVRPVAGAYLRPSGA